MFAFVCVFVLLDLYTRFVICYRIVVDCVSVVLLCFVFFVCVRACCGFVVDVCGVVVVSCVPVVVVVF